MVDYLSKKLWELQSSIVKWFDCKIVYNVTKHN